MVVHPFNEAGMLLDAPRPAFPVRSKPVRPQLSKIAVDNTRLLTVDNHTPNTANKFTRSPTSGRPALRR